ncbi:MAG TPA: PAS domain-containing protein [Myxococcaceae bacterium]|nr:PAS domain-containing protein [Myxococcaceae bacterium]
MNAAAPVSPELNPDALLQGIDSLTEKELDQLPVGMIQLDLNGKILQFNKTEAKMAQINRDRQVGKNFFDQVAPCTKVREFHGRFVDGVQRRKLYETFGFVFKFDHGWRNVAITLMYSNKTDTVWVLVSQKSVTPPPAKA